MLSYLTTGLLGLAIVVLLTILTRRSKRDKNGTTLRPLPGPPGYPLLGNLPQIPALYSYRRFDEWNQQYGNDGIMRVMVGGQTLVILSTARMARELLDKRGSLYSSREQSYMAAELLSDNCRPLLLPYDTLWRNVRKFMHLAINPNTVDRYAHIQDDESKLLLQQILTDPNPSTTINKLERYSGSLILQLTYGIKAPTYEDEIVQKGIQIVHTVEEIAQPGRYLVDSGLPFLRYLPDAIAPFKRHAKSRHKFEADVFTDLLNRVRDNPSPPDCFAKDILRDQKKYNFTDKQAAYVVGTLFEAGSGTTAAALYTFIMAMTKWPHLQQAAWKELDNVVGNRMPMFEDLDKLPYCMGSAKEALRWRPVTAGGVPHMLIQDDNINGYFLPKGSLVFANSWAIHRDPEHYPDPDEFDPTRFMSESSPPLHPFGFGRRLCPGQSIALKSMQLNVTRLLWAFKFSQGSTDPDIFSYTPGFNSQPNEFDFKLEPRNSEIQKVVLSHKYGST